MVVIMAPPEITPPRAQNRCVVVVPLATNVPPAQEQNRATHAPDSNHGRRMYILKLACTSSAELSAA